MKKLFNTIKSIFNSKINKVNKALQVSNCIDLIDEQQVKMAENYKKLTVVINDLKFKRDNLKDKLKTEKKEELKIVIKKNIEVIETTLVRLQKNKELIKSKVEKTEDSRTILIAKKSLLDSISDIKNTTSNVFENQDFDVESIMAEIDQNIRSVESELQADEELNELIK